jgi:hypothetical protein
MNVKCILGLHTWKGCKCSACGKVQDKDHEWGKSDGQCAICGTRIVDILPYTADEELQRTLLSKIVDRPTLLSIATSAQPYKRLSYGLRVAAVLRVSQECELCRRKLRGTSVLAELWWD